MCSGRWKPGEPAGQAQSPAAQLAPMKDMRAVWGGFVFAVAAAMGVVPSGAWAASAMERPDGDWQGTVVLPRGAEADMTFGISDMAGRPLATMSIPGSEVIGPSNLVIKGDELDFTVNLDGAWLRCELTRQPDGSYAGLCSDRDSYEGAIRLWQSAQ